MSLRTVVSSLTTLLIVTLKCDCSPIKEGVQIVTYGDPCVITRQLPIKIEGPKPPRQEQKIPISLNLKVVSDMIVQPRRIEYPIEIEKACTTPPSVERMSTVDTLRGKTYTYNTYVPPASYVLPTQTNYNYAIEVPVKTKNIMEQYQEKRVRLKGLTSRIDRVLVPACEVPS